MQAFVRPQDILDQRLSTNGDGTGTTDAKDDYSGGGLGETKFFVQPALGETFEVYSFHVTLSTATAFEGGEYGDGTSLTNGIGLSIENNSGVVHDFLGGGKINTNAEWGLVLNLDTFIESNNSPAFLTGDTLFLGFIGSPIRLTGSLNERFVVTLNDDMTSRLVFQEFHLSGIKIRS